MKKANANFGVSGTLLAFLARPWDLLGIVWLVTSEWQVAVGSARRRMLLQVLGIGRLLGRLEHTNDLTGILRGRDLCRTWFSRRILQSRVLVSRMNQAGTRSVRYLCPA
jgi:hypothetical protein